MVEVEFQTHIAEATEKTVYMSRALTDASYPYIVQRVITKGNYSMGNTQMRVQLDVYARDPNGYGVAKGIAKDVHDAIHEAQNDIDDITASYRVSEMETFNPETKTYQVIIDAMLYYVEREIFG